MRGAPWETVPGSGTIEIKSKVRIVRTGNAEIVAEPWMKEVIPRRIRFDQDDLKKYEYIIGCQVAERMAGTSEECRSRLEERSEEDDPNWYNRTLGRCLEGSTKRYEKIETRRR